MRYKILIIQLVVFFQLVAFPLRSAAHDIFFCGERIPLTDKFVSQKLMEIIRQQINNINVPELRARINQDMAVIEYYLQATGLPEDFKYLAIVESGFKNQVSSAGAAGFWQLMPQTAQTLGLVLSPVDERNDLHKSTYAACRAIAENYIYIRKKFGISSWVLTAASYNIGTVRIKKAIINQGNNYFQMNLNKETSEYVYKIIAVKELFEYPEIYMKYFGYNVFTAGKEIKEAKAAKEKNKTQTGFGSMVVKVNENDGGHPVALSKRSAAAKKADPETNGKVSYVSAKITGHYKKFEDGGVISFELNDDLQVGNHFMGKGKVILGKGWIIDDRIMVDLGYEHRVILCDSKNQKGLTMASLKDRDDVIMKVTQYK